jgi:hypothetical protein
VVTTRRQSGCTGTRTKPWWMSRVSTCTPISPRCDHWEIGRALEPWTHRYTHTPVRARAEAAAGAWRGCTGDISQRHRRTHAGAAKGNPNRLLHAASSPARRRAGGALASLLVVTRWYLRWHQACFEPKATLFRIRNGQQTEDIQRSAEQPSTCEQALVSHPAVGKHVVFDGRLLHGAPMVPGRAAPPPPDGTLLRPSTLA